MHDWQAFENRLRKVHRQRKSWAARQGLEAYRLYEMDIPELAFVVDVYKDHAVVWDKTWESRLEEQGQDEEAHAQAASGAVERALGIAPDHVHLKRRRRMPGASQYQKLGETRAMLPVKEGKATFLVNLDDYLDTGLFLDHRPLRQRFAAGEAGRSFLNLFCYTGAVSVAAALGGARVTSVDMSNTYLAWAEKNFEANGVDPGWHEFVRADALRYLEDGPREGERYDVVFLDPPTFSNSKRMEETFDVQRDHARLVEQALRFVAPGGKLYFSTNRQKFKLDQRLAALGPEDQTEATIPEDFRDRRIHRCFVFSRRP